MWIYLHTHFLAGLPTIYEGLTTNHYLFPRPSYQTGLVMLKSTESFKLVNNLQVTVGGDRLCGAFVIYVQLMDQWMR